MIPSNFKKEIIELIELGLKPFEIAKKLNLNKTSTQCYIHNSLGYSFSKTHSILYPDYFSEIDSYQKAYWLGFIAADGYLVNNPSKVVGITLAEQDLCVIENFMQAIGSSGNIQKIKPRNINIDNKNYISQNQVRFTIGSKEMFDDLVNLGITPKKSFTLKNIIDTLRYEYRDAFIIGYFDGDGCVILPKGKIEIKTNTFYSSYATQIRIRGTQEFLEGFKSHLGIETSISFNKTFILNINKKQDIIRFTQCYNNLDFFLKRKYNKLYTRLSHSSYNKFIQVQTISSPSYK